MAKARAARASATAARWAKRVERLERSGLSIRTLAAREGLKAGSLSVWKWKLAHGREQRPAAAPAAPLKFVELTAAAPAAPAPAAAFEVLLRSGRTVRVSGGFDTAELARLVGALEEACA
jgi:hypothetical protein